MIECCFFLTVFILSQTVNIVTAGTWQFIFRLLNFPKISAQHVNLACHVSINTELIFNKKRKLSFCFSSDKIINNIKFHESKINTGDCFLVLEDVFCYQSFTKNASVCKICIILFSNIKHSWTYFQSQFFIANELECTNLSSDTF